MSESQDNASHFSDMEVTDPHCVAEKPVRITFQDITSASYLIKSGIEYTPCTVISREIDCAKGKKKLYADKLRRCELFVEIEIHIQWHGFIFKKGSSSIHGQVWLLTHQIPECKS